MGETLDEIISDAEAQAAPGVDVGSAERPCDSTITAIYPVRYGYANLFDDVVAPASPPPIAQLLGATSIAGGQGYVARLLRPGWIYIREEAGGSALQIFRYDRDGTSGGDNPQVVERFSKYLFRGLSATAGLELDRSSGRAFYPFVFVNKGVSEVSILYTEHELDGAIVDRINGDAAFRAETMQRVNLVSGGRDAVEASADNLSRLVEDYRSRRDRVLTDGDLNLADLTTVPSFAAEPEVIARQIGNTECYGDTSMIVALHDPVGRQVEIAQAHAKLAVWEQDHAALNLYPYMIGQFVQAARTSDVEEVAEAAAENVDIPAHDAFWQDMDRQFREFAARRTQIAALYRAFMYPGEETDDVGTLDRYFRYFFAYDAPSEPELVKLLEVAAPVFDGLMASEEGQAMLAALADNAHDAEGDKPVHEQRNAYGAVVKGLIALTTQPQDGLDWARATGVAMDRFMQGLGAFWGRAVADSRFAAQLARRGGYRMSARALQRIVDEVIPKALDVFGIRIVDGRTLYTSDELARLVARALEANVRSGGYAGIEMLERARQRLETGQKVFRWGQNQSTGRLPRLWRLAEVDVVRESGNRFAFTVAEGSGRRVGVAVESGFTGVSAFFNVMTIASLANQSAFSRANPLQRGNMLHDALTFGSALSALTVDLMVLARGGLQLADMSTRVLPAAVAARFAPGITGSAGRLARVLTGTLPSRLIAVANFAMAVTSAWNAVSEFRQGNTGAGVGHALTALGAGALFFGAAGLMAGGAGASASTVVGLPVAVVATILALILVGIGTVLVLIYSKNPLELLLFQCFWGKSRDYAFWQDGNRQPIETRIRRARMMAIHDGPDREAVAIAFRMEVQEFMNLFAMPQLEIDRFGGSLGRRIFGNFWFEDRSYDLVFRLPQFVIGQSEIVVGVYTGGTPNELTGQIDQPIDPAATDRLAAAFRGAIEGGTYTVQQGMMVVSLRIDFGQRANIIWYYEPKPDVVVPMRILHPAGRLRRPAEITVGMLNDRPI
ncbi:hypothetical protein JQC91_17440 [Jannaschia sp. Os4]|uniref:toxin VasX n=1 Tax=Jannaschia sp. Os4 TaxID=2807617 RepID=UPI00193952D8|nr:toxin VasX [Jannaschia sp. Os4]MBM2578094.1 hypothetical protein [Jannaschia sp. Os4]